MPGLTRVVRRATGESPSMRLTRVGGRGGQSLYFPRITPGAGEMLLSETGKTAASALRRIPEMFHGVSIPAFVIMPDHLHMIVRLSGLQRAADEYFSLNVIG